MATRPKSPKPIGPLCVVSINFEEYLLPQAAALKVVALLADAVRVDRDYSKFDQYRIRSTVDVSFQSVKASQIVAAEPPQPPKPAQPLAIGQSPLSLEYDK